MMIFLKYDGKKGFATIEGAHARTKRRTEILN